MARIKLHHPQHGSCYVGDWQLNEFVGQGWSPDEDKKQSAPANDNPFAPLVLKPRTINELAKDGITDLAGLKSAIAAGKQKILDVWGINDETLELIPAE